VKNTHALYVTEFFICDLVKGSAHRVLCDMIGLVQSYWWEITATKLATPLGNEVHLVIVAM
jgi:hypothetical protein